MADTAASAPESSAKRAYIVVGVVAATVSAATAAYIFWSRYQKMHPAVESVQNLLDRCHDQVRAIEQKMSDLVSDSRSTTA